ncbi:MAG: glutaredoxin [Sphingobacteriales bacterium]|uniref:glutaredoxin n=1 Tax=Hydrotalea flava TaxID=714549 RepID=UPI00082FDEC4|nr:glutaredoxin [Hydrotalea flava]RTL47999.1 MAG: glutaredoxin [Sphingobacteriales bacterium]
METQTKRKIELFTAGCTVCEPVVEMVKAMACSSCEVIIYNVAESCDSKECLNKLENFDINTVPAIAVNGKLLSCCQHKGISVEELRSAGIGNVA